MPVFHRIDNSGEGLPPNVSQRYEGLPRHHNHLKYGEFEEMPRTTGLTLPGVQREGLFPHLALSTPFLQESPITEKLTCCC